MHRAAWGSVGESQHRPLGFWDNAMSFKGEKVHPLNSSSWRAAGRWQRQRAWPWELQ